MRYEKASERCCTAVLYVGQCTCVVLRKTGPSHDATECDFVFFFLLLWLLDWPFAYCTIVLYMLI